MTKSSIEYSLIEPHKQNHESHSSFGFKSYIVASMIFLWTGYTLSVRFTRSTTPPDQLYSPPAVVLLGEVMKCCVTILMIGYENDFSPPKFCRTIIRDFIHKPVELLKMSVPSLVYAIQNNLDFVALSNLDAGVYQVTIQLKVVTTAIFMMFFLRRTFSLRRWVAIFMLFSGVAAVQLNNMDERQPQNAHENVAIGLIAVFTTCITAGFAGVYFEKMLKDGSTNSSFWIRNLQMYSCGIVFAFLGCFAGDKYFSFHSFFHGFTPLVYLITAFLSFGGLYISMVMKYLDNLYKSFASAVSIILIVIASFFLFPDVFVGIYFYVGSCTVCIAILLYNSVNE